MAETSAKDRLKRLTVNELFGRFNYDISFNVDEDITIITAPNGYGKTILLKIIDAIINKKIYFFMHLSFAEINLILQSGKIISIYQRQSDLFGDDKKHADSHSISISVQGLGDETLSHEFNLNPNSAKFRYIERYLPIERMDADLWYDFNADITLTTDQLLAHYADRMPDEFAQFFTFPDWLDEIAASVDVHLIETQRLLTSKEQSEVRPRYKSRRTSPAYSTAVQEHANHLAARIQEILQTYAEEAQKLDQTFPERFIELSSDRVQSKEAIHESLESLHEKREHLRSAGLIGPKIQKPLDFSNVSEDQSILRMLSVYIDDTKKKLSVFDDIYRRINLFKEIVNDHFLFKQVEIDPSKGMRVHDRRSELTIPLFELSSGEQHELVLIYELLFKVDNNSVILIDEPELSLHVVWQKRFLSVIEQIGRLKRLQFILATHSPQIIGEHWNWVQDLSEDLTDSAK